jgi:MFS family permease
LPFVVIINNKDSANSHFDAPSPSSIRIGDRYYPVMVMARFLQGASAAATWVAGLALLADTYPSHELGSAMGLVMTAMSLGMLLGPPFGGFVYEWGGYQLPFIIASGISIYERAWSGHRAFG